MYEFICSADEKDSGFVGPVHQSEPWCIKTRDFFDDENPFTILFYSQKIPINPLFKQTYIGDNICSER